MQAYTVCILLVTPSVSKSCAIFKKIKCTLSCISMQNSQRVAVCTVLPLQEPLEKFLGMNMCMCYENAAAVSNLLILFASKCSLGTVF